MLYNIETQTCGKHINRDTGTNDNQRPQTQNIKMSNVDPIKHQTNADTPEGASE